MSRSHLAINSIYIGIVASGDNEVSRGGQPCETAVLYCIVWDHHMFRIMMYPLNLSVRIDCHYYNNRSL